MKMNTRAKSEAHPPKSETTRHRGRPKKNLDERQVEILASMMCSIEEIAHVMGCDRGTLADRFSTAIAKGRSLGKISLRRAQFKSATRGNAVMLIWLGKQYLGQTDKLPDFSKLTNEQLLAIAAGLFNDPDEAEGPKAN